MTSTSVILFAKEPLVGYVKTRLHGALGADGATALYRAFVTDMVTRIGAMDGISLILAVDPGPSPEPVNPEPTNGNASLADLAPFLADLAHRHGAKLVRQPDGHLGTRMATTLADQLKASGTPVVLMGTDLPTVPLNHLQAALKRLQRHDLVFCPTTDGGYYLVGARPEALDRWPQITETVFEQVPWSSPKTLHTTLFRARAAQLNVALGPAWYDVDDAFDLDLLVNHLVHSPRPPLPATRTALRLGKP